MKDTILRLRESGIKVQKRSGPIPTDPVSRFNAKYAVKETGCWEWIDALSVGGYGRFWDGEIQTYAHQFSFRIHGGKIPTGMVVMHRCDNPKCVNPAHLMLGTQLDNIADMNAKGRQYTRPMKGEENGRAKLREEQVVEILKCQDSADVIALRYDVTVQLIRLIKTRRCWKHVSPEIGA